MTALIKYFQALCKDTTPCEVNHTSGKTQMSLHASLRCPSSLQQHQLKSYQKAFPLLAAMTFSSQLGPYQVERTQLWHLSLRLTLQRVFWIWRAVPELMPDCPVRTHWTGMCGSRRRDQIISISSLGKSTLHPHMQIWAIFRPNRQRADTRV